MKIAIISYEYPPDTAYGGIATYMYQIAKMLTQRGHLVEVFACSPYRSGTHIEDGIKIHRILEENRTNRRNFSGRIGKVFAERHTIVHFDVVEGAEAGAHTKGSLEINPDIPLVIKLHTPTFMIDEINYVEPSLQMKIRRFFGALRRGQKPKPFFHELYNINTDIERLHTLEADEITTPSKALGEKLIAEWQLPSEKVFHIPNPYIPSEELLNIPVETQTDVVTFIGRLELRKGVLELTQAIPNILQQYPKAKFRFVGALWPSPQPGLDMRRYIEKQLKRYSNSLEFTGPIPLDSIPSILATTDVCVFPSRWENFPNVCLEAMVAARGVVGSNAGGMFDMLDSGKAGLLVPPHAPDKIAEAVVELLKNPKLRMQLGRVARDRVLSEYNLERIGALQEASYIRAIERRQALGKRVADYAV
ncbi:glycosyltransferase family 4 protein [Nostoc sp. FACHB-190]|uniref:glycosyltransferase family 4 protein n=1 Tax=Nostoc sp. FACHB-190 TaxID=2692838 RepID=UPI001688DEE4|nr:glycosyltransferase family 4 protein [Nostoc sp. FACHB-190]MBD2297305.1 glycosyltransferase family 4 protein [Nostoc sp. FACHB-190]